MPQRALIRPVGRMLPTTSIAALAMVLTTATLATAAIPATSLAQDATTINQGLTGDVTTTQTLNVVTENYGLTQVEGQAVGNSAQGGNDTVNATVTTTQNASANITAEDHVFGHNVGGDETLSLGTPVYVTTQSIANYNSHVAQDANADVTLHQTSTGAKVTATTDIQAPNNAIYDSGEGDAVTEVNHTAYQVSNGRLNAAAWQTSSSESNANTSATVHYSPSDNLYTASATNNYYGAYSDDRGSQDHDIHQDQSAQTLARAEVYGGNMWNVAAQGTSVANNVDIENAGGYLGVTSNQHQVGSVYSQAYVQADEYGTADVSAVGIGNQLNAGNNDVTVQLDATQIADGGVDVTSTFEGNTGYDSYISAEAYGNQALAYACAECKADFNATSNQVNNGDVNATTNVTTSGSNRSIVSSAKAIGNSATYYVSGGH